MAPSQCHQVSIPIQKDQSLCWLRIQPSRGGHRQPRSRDSTDDAMSQTTRDASGAGPLWRPCRRCRRLRTRPCLHKNGTWDVSHDALFLGVGWRMMDQDSAEIMNLGWNRVLWLALNISKYVREAYFSTTSMTQYNPMWSGEMRLRW